MSTNGVNTSEDTEMEDCDGEKVVTMMDVLQEQQDFEDDANAVLGASDDKDCTFSKGYIKRQAIYACLTCCSEAKEDDGKRAGVCLACSLNCHEDHELVELYTRRNFCCDCGNPKFNGNSCQFTSNKTDTNEDNIYNQNFSGLYCTCHRPYPDPEATFEDEMIQCIVCEDWLHTSHIEATVPAQDLYSEMICKICMDKNEFLHDYSEFAVNILENENVDVTIIKGSTMQNGDLESKTNGNNESSMVETHMQDETDVDMSTTKQESEAQMQDETDVDMCTTNKESGTDKAATYNKETISTKQFINESSNVVTAEQTAVYDLNENDEIKIDNGGSKNCNMKEITLDNEESLGKDTETSELREELATEATKEIEDKTTETELSEKLPAEPTEESESKRVDTGSNEDTATGPIKDSVAETVDTELKEESTVDPVNDSETKTDNTQLKEELATDKETEAKTMETDIKTTEAEEKDGESEPKPEEANSTEMKCDIQNENDEKEQQNVAPESPEISSINSLTADTVPSINQLSEKREIPELLVDSEDNKEIEAIDKLLGEDMAQDDHEKPGSDGTEIGKMESTLLEQDTAKDTTEENVAKTDTETKTDKSDIEKMETDIETTEPCQENEDNSSESIDKSKETEKTTEDTEDDSKKEVESTEMKTFSTEPDVADNTTDSVEVNGHSKTETSDVRQEIEDNSSYAKRESMDESKETKQATEAKQDDSKKEVKSTEMMTFSTEPDDTSDSVELNGDSKTETSDLCANGIEALSNDTQDIKENKRKFSTEGDDQLDVRTKKAKLDEHTSPCVRPKGVKKIFKGATFWGPNFRQKLCTCSECISMYKDLSVLFLIDPEDTVTAYEALGKERTNGTPATQYEKGLQALSSLDRIQQINAMTEYNKMRDKLVDFLKSFKDRKEVVKEEDIKAFFAGMKPSRESDGVYFCR